MLLNSSTASRAEDRAPLQRRLEWLAPDDSLERAQATGGATSVDNLAIKVPDGTISADLRRSLDLTTPVDDLLDLAEESTAGIKFADCIPGWLADSIALARRTDAPSVARVVEGDIATGHVPASG